MFTPSLPGHDARRFGKQLLAQHALEGIELYPKQDELRTGPGSLVRLPLGVHRKSGRRYPFVTLSGEPLAPTIREQIHLLGTPARVERTFINRVLAESSEESLASPNTRTVSNPVPRSRETVSARIKKRISVYDFVSQYVELDRQGRGHCPFHDDLHKSFSVNIRDDYWHCFAGCGGGSLIDFWMGWREAHGQEPDFTATITELAKMLL